MDKKELEQRLAQIEKVREAHLQDAKEMQYVIDGLKKDIESCTSE